MVEQKKSKLGLIRQVGLIAAIAMIVGNVIGDAIFISTGPMLSGVGPALVISMTIAIIPIIFICLYNILLGGALPVTMADYVVTSRALGPFAGWLIFCSAIGLWAMALGIEGFAFGAYLAELAPAAPILPVSLGILLILGVINYFGIRVAAIAQIIMTALFVVLPLLIFIFGGWPHMQVDLHQPLFPLGVGAMLFMVVPAVWCYIGFTSITNFAGEIKNPRRTIPLTLAISLGIIVAIYLAVAWVLSGLVPWEEAAATAIGTAAMGFLPESLGIFVVCGALFAFATTMNMIMVTAPRAIVALARDNVLPASGFFSRINRFRTPDAGLLVIVVIGLLGAPLAYNILAYIVVIIIFMMVIHILNATGVYLLPKKLPDIWAKAAFKFTPFWRGFACIGTIVLAAIILAMGVVMEGWTGVVIVLGALVLGSIYWFARKGYLRRRGIDLDKELRELHPDTKAELEGV